MPNSFHQFAGCSVRHMYLCHTSKSCFSHSYVFSLSLLPHVHHQEDDTLTTHSMRSWLWDSHVCYKKDATQPMTKNLGLCSGKTLDLCTILPKSDFQSHWCCWKCLCKSQQSSLNWTRFHSSHCQNNVNRSKGFYSHSHGYSWLLAANSSSTWPNTKLLQLAAFQPRGSHLSQFVTKVSEGNRICK